MGILEIQKLKEQAKLPKEKKVYYIPKKSAKKIAAEKALNILEDKALDNWFEESRKEMTGICANCGGKTSKDDDKYYRFCIAHILPKAIFKSVATHKDNWIELCFFGNSCHTNYDNNIIDLTDLKCFDEVVEKFLKMYPSISLEERRRIPKVLLQYVEPEKQNP